MKGQSINRQSLKAAVKQDTQTLSREVKRLHREFEKTIVRLKGDIERRWGKKEVKVAKPKVYVKYTENYGSRAIVDFDRGEVTVETLDAQNSQKSLQRAIVITLLTTNDPQSVDLFSDKNITLKSDRDPYLLGLVLDQNGRAVGTPKQAEQFAAYLVKKKSKVRKVGLEKGAETVHYVNIKMVKNFESKQVARYRPFVTKFSKQFKISPSLVYAVMQTESNFNPFAVSSAPAYGLMQLVPTSGGRAAYQRAKGSDSIPSPEYLFDPENNIELGTAYLNVLSYNELKSVSNTTSREYCVIAAYNTGPGNLLRTFSKNRKTAVHEINSLKPGELYTNLLASLPYKETRHYLVKVVTNRKRYIRSSNAGL